MISLTEIISEIQLSFEEFMSTNERIESYLEKIEKEINNSKPNDKILSQYQNIERSYNNLKRNYKKSKKEYEDYLRKFQKFAQSKTQIDYPKYNTLHDSYKAFKKERESDLEEFKKISTQYESLAGKNDSSSSRELSQVSHNNYQNQPEKASKTKFFNFNRKFHQDMFPSNNIASQVTPRSLIQNFYRDTFKESRKESHVITILY
jgi:NADH dehydrogenase/NADH:ubiquinone oxidoreductase subunit G